MASAKPVAASKRKDLTGPALRTFFRIAEAWGLKEAEQMSLLGLDKRSTFQSWKRGAVMATGWLAIFAIVFLFFNLVAG